MKSAYEIAWDLMPHHLNRNPVDVSVLLDKLSDLTGVSMTELLKMRHKHEIVTALAPYKDRIALLREVIDWQKEDLITQSLKKLPQQSAKACLSLPKRV